MANRLQQKLRGTGVALITPFTQNFEIDEKTLRTLVEKLINDGVDYLVALGTTSEAATLSAEERRIVTNIIISQNNNRIPLVVGIGGNNTQEIVHTIKNFDFTGIDAILSVTPYYTRPQQDGLYEHFKMISEASPLPIILYNVPARTAVNMKPETTLRLANDFSNIIGIKEASGIENQIMKIILHKPNDFLVISGDDAITLSLVAAGADGVISVVGNAFSKELVQMVNFCLEDKFAQARTLHYQLLEFIQICFKDGSPSGVKAIMSEQNRIQNVVRLPLVPVNNEVHLQISNMVAAFSKTK